ncbi:MAG: ATP-binding protein [bacterium]
MLRATSNPSRCNPPATGGQHPAQPVVHDTGRGMNREQLDRLFEPFGQVHEGRQQGSGLGLHLSKVIVDAHGGTIRIESPGPEQGATVTIELPLKRSAGAGAGPVIHPDLV